MRKTLKQTQLLDLKMIKRTVTRGKTYQDGMGYYLNGKVVETRYDKAKNELVGIVKGREAYSQIVKFTGDSLSEITSYSCTCPAYENYSGMCKHLVAALVAYSDSSIEKKVEEPVSIKESAKGKIKVGDINVLKSIISRENAQNNKKQVYIKPCIEQGHNRYGGQSTFYTSFTMREEGGREYKMQNIIRFAYTYMNKSSFEFTKKFIYNPLEHTVSEPMQKLIEYIHDKAEHGVNSYQGINAGGEVLNERGFERFLKLLYENKIPFNFQNKSIVLHNIVIEPENLELNVILEKENDNIKLKFNGERKESMKALTQSSSFFLYTNGLTKEEKIWYVGSDKIKKYEFIGYMSEHKGNVNLGACKKEDIAAIVSNINSIVKDFTVSKNLSENIVNETLTAHAYLDKLDDGVSLKLEYIYGGERINPVQVLNTDKIIMRNEDREQEIGQCVESFGFGVEKDIYALTNNENIYDFVSKDLDILREKVDEIYYSDEFKNIKVKPKTNFKASTRMGDNNLLEISFDYGDIDKDEIHNILKAFRQKKKYHRLKDGSFLNLDDENIQEMEDIIGELDISDKRLLDEKIQMPIFRMMYLDSKLKNLDKFVLDKDKQLTKLLKDIKTGKDIKHEVPAVVKDTLREYQTEGYKWLKTLDAYNFGAILADDMGLGKTLQFITFLLSINDKKEHPNLIVTPTSLVYNWQSEFEKFAEGKFKVGIISGNKDDRNNVLENYKDYDILITSYPLIRRDGHLYEDKIFEYVVLDEAQHIKNHSSITAKTIKILNAKKRFALTGTPIENNLLELWSIFDFILPGYLHTYNKFLTNYDKKIMKDDNKDVLKNLNRHISPFILRRLKKDVLKELPDKIETKMITELTGEQKKLYVAELSKAKKEISQEIKNEGFERSKIKILAILTRLRQICCHPAVYVEGYKGGSGKLELLNELVDEVVERGGKALIFSQFTSMLAIIQDELKKKGIEYLYLDGSVKSSERLGLVNRFNNGDIKFFLISLKAGGTGLNLTSADTVIHFDPWWNPAVEEQATDRAHRIGQKNVVQVMKIITRGTIEEKIYEMQQKKKKLIDSVITEGANSITSLTENEIYSLFE
ncbi:MAG TPA: helicase [Clostridiales bacterium]|nr:MAG: hypothetical protein A2Y22_02100 [Clostridiales bacterium GWD2_32_59]HAN09602.1 helicase [Clostridiales bacterium]